MNAHSPAPDLRIRDRDFPGPLVMGIINRTPDSFYPAARQMNDVKALDAAVKAVDEGADIVDVGGVRAGRGRVIDPGEEVERVIPFITTLRQELPQTLISIDTWRYEVAREAAEAGVDIINDTWAGADEKVVEVAAEFDLGLVCSHTGGMPPRTDPFRAYYPEGVVKDVVETLRDAAQRYVDAGVHPRSVLVDPTHDFGKTTWHSLELLQHTEELVALGYPVLMALSRKDFVGETLDLPVDERLEGTLAATTLAAWKGATIFRAHDVQATKRTLQMVATLRAERQPSRVIRGMG